MAPEDARGPPPSLAPAACPPPPALFARLPRAQVPVLYKWVHKHHHQQTYPDRAVIDTLNTGCVESQVGTHTRAHTHALHFECRAGSCT